MNNCINAPNALSHTCRVRREDVQRLEELSEVGHSVGALRESGPQVHVRQHQLLPLRYVHDCRNDVHAVRPQHLVFAEWH